MYLNGNPQVFGEKTLLPTHPLHCRPFLLESFVLRIRPLLRTQRFAVSPPGVFIRDFDTGDSPYPS